MPINSADQSVFAGIWGVPAVLTLRQSLYSWPRGEVSSARFVSRNNEVKIEGIGGWLQEAFEDDTLPDIGYSRAQGSFFERKRCSLNGSHTFATPNPDVPEEAALAHLYATRLFWEMEDVIYEFLLRRGTACGEDRPDLCSSTAPTRTRQANTTRRRGARWIDSLCFLLLIGLGQILLFSIRTSSLQLIDR